MNNQDDFLDFFYGKDSDKRITICREEDTIWSYSKDETDTIVADCWIANSLKGEPRDMDYYRNLHVPPPAREDFIAENIDPLDFSKLEVLWDENGESATILYNQDKLVMFKSGEKKGYSKNLKKDGPWGNAWKIE